MSSIRKARASRRKNTLRKFMNSWAGRLLIAEAFALTVNALLRRGGTDARVQGVLPSARPTRPNR